MAITRDGKKEPADLRRMVEILKSAKYRGYVVLEYEEAKPWDEIPEYIDLLRKFIS